MNLHVIIGEDDYLVAETAKKFLGDGTGLEVIDSRTATKAELQLADIRRADESFSTPPFFDPKKATWWKNVHFLPHAGKGAPSAEVKEALERFAKKLASLPLPENQVFILSGPTLLRGSVFEKTLAPVAEMAVFSLGKPWERKRNAVLRAVELASALGLSFAPDADTAFVNTVGTDTRSLLRELEKMRDYLGPTRQTIAAADVAAVSSPGVGVEPELWGVTDAIGARNVSATLTAVRAFEGEDGFEILLTSVIERFFRQLLAAKDAQAQGQLEAALEGLTTGQRRKIPSALRNWSLRELRIARYRFLRLREAAVTGGTAVGDRLYLEIVRTLKGAK